MPSEALPQGPSSGAQSMVRQIAPSPGAWVVGICGVLVLGLCQVVGNLAVVEFSAPDGSMRTGLFAYGLIALTAAPLTALFLGVGGLVSGHFAPRAMMLIATAGMLFLGGVSCVEASFLIDAPAGPSAVLVALTYGPYALLTLMLALVLVTRVPWAWREEVVHEQLDWLEDVLRTRGVTTLPKIQLALQLDPEGTEELLLLLAASRQLPLRVHTDSKRVYTAHHVSQQLDRMRTLLLKKDTTILYEMAFEVDEPEDIAEKLLDELVEAGLLQATIDRTMGEVVNHTDPRTAPAPRWCRDCGGPMRAVVPALTRCVHCPREEDL